MLQEIVGVKLRPIGFRRMHSLLLGSRDQHLDNLAAGQICLQQAVHLLPDVLGVPQRPFRVGAVRADKRAVMGRPGLVKNCHQLISDSLWHSILQGVRGKPSGPTEPRSADIILDQLHGTAKTFALTVVPPVAITTAGYLPSAVYGEPYSQTLSLSGGWLR